MKDVLKTEGSGDRRGLGEEVTFELRPDGVREQAKQLSGEEHSRQRCRECKGPGAGTCLPV